MNVEWLKERCGWENISIIQSGMKANVSIRSMSIIQHIIRDKGWGGNFSHEEKQHPFICEYRGTILDEEEEAVFIHLYTFLLLIQHQLVKTIFMLTNSFLLFWGA